MLSLLKRHYCQVFLAAGHPPVEVARAAGVSARSVRRIAQEARVTEGDDRAERRRRRLGRPSQVAPFREVIAQLLETEPALQSLEILRRLRGRGYAGGKSALYALVRTLRPPRATATMRFEGLPGEFSQHDFGQVDVRFLAGTAERVHFFASRLKYSRWAEVTLVPNETAETLIRTLANHFVAFGGVPLCCVFDRPKTVALKWQRNGEVTEWNPTFAYAALELGFTAEVCWPYQPQQKGAVENLVGWVKGSFFKQRRFHDRADLTAQLRDWLHEMNTDRPNRATGQRPAERLAEERARLRPPRMAPAALALRLPVSVGPTGAVVHQTHSYSMPPEAAGLPATLYLYPDTVRIVAGRFAATHPRQVTPHAVSTLPEHRAAHLAALSGKRGQRYLKRQHLFETGAAAVAFLTELVHRQPRSWIGEVDQLHALLQAVGPQAMDRAFRAALDLGAVSVPMVAQCLGRPVPALRPPDPQVPA
jgi:transposase